MKTLLIAALLLVSVNSQAGTMWTLIHQEFSGSIWFCTYQAQGTNYTSTITSNSGCQPYIFQ